MTTEAKREPLWVIQEREASKWKLCIRCGKAYRGQRISRKYCSALCRTYASRERVTLTRQSVALRPKPHCKTCTCEVK